MHKYFDNIMDIPLSGDQIKSALDNKTKILRYRDLLNYDNIDDILKPYNNFVLLYEQKPRYGHWVCVILHKKSNTLEYYDPYGMFIDKVLDFVDPTFKNQSGQSYPYLSYLFENSPYKIIYNNKKLQEKKNSIATCGRHIISRILLKDISLKKYQDIFKIDRKVNADDKVSFLTAGIVNKF